MSSEQVERILELKKKYTRFNDLKREINKEHRISTNELRMILEDNSISDVILKKAKVMKDEDYSSINSFFPNDNWQIDYMYIENPNQNKKYRYMLNIIDVYSRKLLLYLPTKTRKDASKIIINTIEHYKKHGPVMHINGDQEFNTKNLNDYARENDIKLYFSEAGELNKNAIVERVNRTLRELILKWETENNKGFIDNIQEIVENNYNNSEHRTIGMTPNEAYYKKDVPKPEIRKKESNFEVGDIVKHLITKKIFDKASSTAPFTIQNYKIVENIENNNYSFKLQELKSPFRVLKKKFKWYELRKVPKNIVESETQKKQEKYEEKKVQEKKEANVKRKLNKEGISEKNIINKRKTR